MYNSGCAPPTRSASAGMTDQILKQIPRTPKACRYLMWHIAQNEGDTKIGASLLLAATEREILYVTSLRSSRALDVIVVSCRRAILHLGSQSSAGAIASCRDAVILSL